MEARRRKLHRLDAEVAKESKSFTAKDAKDAKENRSFTAKDAKDAKEKKSFTAKDAKESIIRTKPKDAKTTPSICFGSIIG